MGISENTWIFVACVTIAYLSGLWSGRSIGKNDRKLDVTQKGTRVRYKGSKDGKWKFGVIEEDIVGAQTLVILRGVELELDEIDQLVVKTSHRIFPIKIENMEILGYDDVWLKKDLV